jgi:predicted metal-binding membrane protein
VSLLEQALKRDRTIALAALALACAAAWAYLAAMGPMTAPVAWSAGYAAMVFLMWAVMMVAMMLPSASPTVLLYARVLRREAGGKPATGAFAAGYVAVWTAFSAAATLTQWGLERPGWLSSAMASTSGTLTGALLIIAGAYQLTPLKGACLAHCRSPFDFLLRRWRPGVRGALAMGAEHGLYCVGCCWALMLILFAGGVMNLVVIAALTLYVLIEKLAAGGTHIARAAAWLLIAAGAWVAITG